MSNILNWLVRLFRKPKRRRRLFVIADTHFGHRNIIRYCHRPFSNTRQMNEAMIRKWNQSVKPWDIVYFLGDLAHGRRTKLPGYWLKRLNGKKILIKGNHDKRIRGVAKCKVIRYKGYKFILTHYPRVFNKTDRKTWLIHGHVHNNKIGKYPFINGYNRTINIGVELTDYRPVRLDFLVNIDLARIKRMKNIKSRPVRW